VQIGDPNRIAEVTGITTVADFRRRDMAAGGQGAPLVPPFHAALFRSTEENRAVLNLGGIGNFTLLPADPAASVSGFDTGPGNALMDDWIRHRHQHPFDRHGEWAASGAVDQTLLRGLLDDPYLSVPPPKSTGREHYNLTWLQDQLASHVGDRQIDDADLQATLCAFTAESVARALANLGRGHRARAGVRRRPPQPHAARRHRRALVVPSGNDGGTRGGWRQRRGGGVRLARAPDPQRPAGQRTGGHRGARAPSAWRNLPRVTAAAHRLTR
jgi:1,6-anhydro-N-acetylmuramate kinase